MVCALGIAEHMCVDVDDGDGVWLSDMQVVDFVRSRLNNAQGPVDQVGNGMLL
jgi:hypothetical protein